MDIKEKYQQSVDNYAIEVATLKRKNNAFITAELLLFSAVIALVVCFFSLDGDTGQWLLGAVCALVAYFYVRQLDDKNKNRIDHLSSLLRVCQNELRALEGDFSPFESGDSYQLPEHPYAFDLDVFGKDSLFQRICRTITTGGSDALAAHLSHESPLPTASIERSRDLQSELSAASSFDWRMEFLALGEKNKIDTSAVADAIRQVSALQVPAWFGSSLSLFVGCLLIIGVCASVLLSILGMVSANVPLFWVMLQFMVVFSICKATLDKIDSNGGKLRSQLVAYSQILQLIAQRNFHSKMGREMQGRLAEALPSFAQLEKILKGYDRRGNFLGLFFTDSFMLSDFFLVRSFLKWKKTYMVKMEDWMIVVGEMDAMVSMANYRYLHPEAKDAEILSDEQEESGTTEQAVPVVYEAKNLYHPFLGEKAVKNDFTIHDDHYYIITGANMAGKSTFLRALGVNYILAMAGMPVFADSLRISRFRLFSSMRTTDDLTHGISYFNAELLRLGQLLQFCQKSRLRTLIILDEILKGTNSVDKLNGSRLFLQAISQWPVTGIIATHDLELSKMEQEPDDDVRLSKSLHGRFHNYCFEIELGTDVTYTYKITRGVARNQNATFLLKNLIAQSFSQQA